MNEVLDAEAWNATLRDAEVEHLGIEVFPYETSLEVDLPTAALFVPGTSLDETESRVRSGIQLERFNRHLERHRILLRVSGSPVVLSAKLRHELEHVRQWEHGGDQLFQLYHAANAGNERYIGPDRRGAGVVYNIVPLEADANAAASRFIRPRIDTKMADELGESLDGVLFREQPAPEPVDTAGVRTVCFASLAADTVEEWLGNDPGGARGVLDAIAGDASLWDRLRSDERLRHLVQQAHLRVPTTAAVSARAPDFRLAWAPLRLALLRAYGRAREVADV